MPSFVDLMQHHLYTTLFIAWMLSNAASAMPTPGPSTGAFYRWLFGFMHATFGAIPRMMATMYPTAWSKLTGAAGSQDGPPAQPAPPKE